MILSMSLISLNHSLGKSQHVKYFNTLSLLHSPHVFHLDQSLFILILRQQMFKHLECKILHQRWCAEEESLLLFLQLSCTDFQPWMGLYPNPTAVVDNYFFFCNWSLLNTKQRQKFEQAPERSSNNAYTDLCPGEVKPQTENDVLQVSVLQVAAVVLVIVHTGKQQGRVHCLQLLFVTFTVLLVWWREWMKTMLFNGHFCKNYCELENYSLCVWSCSLSFVLRSFANMGTAHS